MKVLLIDDHTLVRAGIRRLVEDIPGVVVVAEADNGEQAAGLAREQNPDVVLVDISMPRMNGLQLTAWLGTHLPECKVIVLSMHSSDDYVHEALRAGARGYLLKHSVVEELKVALCSVFAGHLYLSPGVSRAMIGQMQRAPCRRPVITPRQREVLKLVALGRSTKEIAAQLRISRRTVDTHRAELMARLGARDTVGLLREAARLGLVDFGGER